MQAVVQKGGGALLLKRGASNGHIDGYELPGGRLENGEQPEDAVKRHLEQSAGLDATSIELVDAISLKDDQTSGINNVFIVFKVSTSLGRKVEVGSKYQDYKWFDASNKNQVRLRNSASVILQTVIDGVSKQINSSDLPKKSENSKPNVSDDTNIVYSDGGSRGNPGHSAAGYVIMDSNEQVIDKGGLYLGITTNNQAEYHGVRIGLERALEIGAKKIDFRMDSMLVVNQMNGTYKIKSKDLWPIHERIKELATKFEKVTFSHVRREFNKLADAAVNEILDAHKQNNQ